MIRRIAGFLVLVIVAAGASGLLWLRSSVPQDHAAQGQASRTVSGINAEIRITRDGNGVPTITASDASDAAFALGYIHAEDRLFQMDLQRHYAAGRLAEWFGEPALDSDRLMRTLGFSGSAERQFADLPPEVQAALKSYAAGVNAYLANRRTALPPEYYVLRATPAPWRPVDSLLWGKLMAWTLAGNYRTELVRARVAEHIKPEDMNILYPSYPKDGPVVLGDLTGIYRLLPLDGLAQLMPAREDPLRASNNWVVSGAHTVSGKPLLANDPHLGIEAPDIWYLARIVTPDHVLAGATAAGAPFVIIGHNEKIAWGFTNTGSDVSDLFVEKIDPDDPTHYLAPDGSHAFDTRTEEIRVRGQAPVSLIVRETRHGPVISDLAGTAQDIAKPGYVLALQASFLMDGDRTPVAFWNMDQATDWAGFHNALADFGAPQQNIVYADTDGHIGFMAPARVPIRAKGDGSLPVPGWTGEYDWTGFIPFEALPMALDPPSGRIVTANNKIVPDDYPYFLSQDWDSPYRAARITALIDQMPQSPDISSAIQRDIYSPMAEQLLPLMLKAPAATPRDRAAMTRLAAWDRRMDKDKVEPLLFIAWLREFTRGLFADKLGSAFDAYWDLHPDTVYAILTAHPDWCDAQATVAAQACDAPLAAALARALDELGKTYGDNMDEWRWGRAHQAEFRHAFFSHVPVLNRLFGLSIPADGGADTIDRGAISIRDRATPFRVVLAPGLRMVVDLADPGQTRFMITPGQSGNPLSPHYGDLMRPWRDGYMMMLGDQTQPATEILSPPSNTAAPVP